MAHLRSIWRCSSPDTRSKIRGKKELFAKKKKKKEEKKKNQEVRRKRPYVM
jgi:hypothetical protein